MATDANRAPTRRLRLFLRDFRMLEASITLAEGQSLISWLANRKSYVKLSAARWSGDNTLYQVALRIDQILWAAAADSDIPLTTASSQLTPRDVEILLEGGLLLRAGMILGEMQRLNDYLESLGTFIPVRGARLLKSGRPPKDVNVALGDIVVNQSAVQAVWEVARQTAPVGAGASSDASH